MLLLLSISSLILLIDGLYPFFVLLKIIILVLVFELLSKVLNLVSLFPGEFVSSLVWPNNSR